MSDLLDGTGHPRHHGYAQCAKCGTQRPDAELLSDDGEKTGTPIHCCRDVTWCAKQAGKATGLDANGDAL